MERLPVCLFNHILDIYSGKSNFPGNLACASKRCKALCDAFKNEKLLLEDRVLVRVYLHASYLNAPVHKKFFSNVNICDCKIELPNYDFLLEGFEGEFKLKEGWNIEKMTVMLVTKSKTLVQDLDWDSDVPFGYRRLEEYNFEAEDILGDNAYASIKNYSLAVGREYNGDDEESLVIDMVEWRSHISGMGSGRSTDIRTLMQNWDQVIILN